VRQLLVRSLRFHHDHPDVAAIIANSRHELLAAERFDFLHTRGAAIRTSWIAVLERGMAQGVFRADLDTDLTYKAVMGAVSAVPNWYRASGARSIDEIAEVFLHLFLCGMAEPVVARPRQRRAPATRTGNGKRSLSPR
jgi:hypothetical protein